MTDKNLPMLKPLPGELSVECPKCHWRVSETCCAYQDFDYYKDCGNYLNPPPLTPADGSAGLADAEHPAPVQSSVRKARAMTDEQAQLDMEEAIIRVYETTADTEEQDVDFFLDCWMRCLSTGQQRDLIKSFRRQMMCIAAGEVLSRGDQ